MNKFFILLKANLKLIFYSNKDSQKSKSKQVMTKALISLLVLYALGICTLYIYLFANELNKLGVVAIILPMALIISSFIIFFTSVYQAQSYLFGGKYNDFLLSIPIPKVTVMLVKIATLYIEGLLFSLLVMIPTGIIYTYYTSFSIGFWLIYIVECIFVPVIPLILTVIVGYVIGSVSNKFKHKSAISVIFSVLLISLIMIGSFKIQSLLNFVVSNAKSLEDIISGIYLPAKYFYQSLVQTNALEMVKFIAISAIPAAILLYLLSLCYFKILSKLSETYSNKKYEVKNLKQSSQFLALYKKEMKRYLSSSIYVMNTSIGMIMLLILSIAMLVGGQSIVEKLTDIPDILNYLPMAAVACTCMVCAMSSTSGSSISIEGSNLWIIKTLPVSASSLFLAKALVNLTVIIPILYISIILFTFSIKFTVVQLIIAFVLPTILAVFVSTFGILVNLKLPRTDATDVVIVKQSASSFISMIGGMLLIMALIMLYIFVASKVMSFEIYSLFIGLVLFLAAIACIIIINNKGSEMLNKVQ